MKGYMTYGDLVVEIVDIELWEHGLVFHGEAEGSISWHNTAPVPFTLLTPNLEAVLKVPAIVMPTFHIVDAKVFVPQPVCIDGSGAEWHGA